MYKLFYFVLSMLITFSLNAQSVTGTVTDAASGSPLSNATVKVQLADSSSSPSLTVSDSKGNFIFNNLGNGQYNLSITSIGYAALQREVTMAGQSLNLGNIDIAKSAETLSTVVVSGVAAVRQKTIQ